MGVGGSVGLYFDRCVGYSVDCADGITFGLDDECDVGYYRGLFDGFNYVKLVG